MRLAIDAIGDFNGNRTGDQLGGTGIVLGGNLVLTAAHVLNEYDDVDDEDGVGFRGFISGEFVFGAAGQSFAISDEAPINYLRNADVLHEAFREEMSVDNTSFVQQDLALVTVIGELPVERAIGLGVFIDGNDYNALNVQNAGFAGGVTVARDEGSTNLGFISDPTFPAVFNADLISAQGQSGGPVFISFGEGEDEEDFVIGVNSRGRITSSNEPVEGADFPVFTADEIRQIAAEVASAPGVNVDDLPRYFFGGSSRETEDQSLIIIEGTVLRDLIIGGVNDETLEGGAADDEIIGGAGDDTIDGGDDVDTVDYSRDGGDEAIKLSVVQSEVEPPLAPLPAQIIVTDTHGDTDTLINIEVIKGTENDDDIDTQGLIEIGVSYESNGGQDRARILQYEVPLEGDPLEFNLFDALGFGTIDYSSFDSDDTSIELVAADPDLFPEAGDFVFSVVTSDNQIQNLASVEGITATAGDDTLDFTITDDDGSFGYAVDAGLGDDVVIGGEGNDFFQNIVGNDTLTGGGGGDVYAFDRVIIGEAAEAITGDAGGVDDGFTFTITDSDEDDRLVIDGQTLLGGSPRFIVTTIGGASVPTLFGGFNDIPDMLNSNAITSAVYQSHRGLYGESYFFDAATGTLTVSFTGGSNQLANVISIENFERGDFGLDFGDLLPLSATSLVPEEVARDAGGGPDLPDEPTGDLGEFGNGLIFEGGQGGRFVQGDGFFEGGIQDDAPENPDGGEEVELTPNADGGVDIEGSFRNDNAITGQLDGTNFSDRINGNEGNDFIVAGDGNDSISGGDGDDFLDAGAGDDVVDGGKGINSSDGGEGFDVAVFDGALDDYLIINRQVVNDGETFSLDYPDNLYLVVDLRTLSGAGEPEGSLFTNFEECPAPFVWATFHIVSGTGGRMPSA